MKQNKKTKKKKLSLKEYIKKYKYRLLLIALFVVFCFLRFYEFETKNPFGWDQVDNAWVAKNIIVDKNFPLVGMQAKLNSGIYIGPIYYYYITLFYWLTNLNPIASGLIAGFSGIITFFTIYYFIKKLFNEYVALLSVFFYTISFHALNFDRIQWPVNFLPAISILIFYALYKSITDKPKYLLLVAVGLGLSVHLHFTALFFPLIILCTLPLFKFTKETFQYIALSILVFVLFLIPNIIHLTSGNGGVSSEATYFSQYYHGLHLRRVLQLAKDAFIEFESVLYFPYLKYLKYLFVPLFIFIYLKNNTNRKTIILCYLIALWFIIPWLVFSVYRGEISNYYFSTTRPIVVMIFGYIAYRVFSYNNKIVTALLIIGLLYYSIINLQLFFKMKNNGTAHYRASVMEKIDKGEVIEFVQGSPESFIYYIYTEK